MQQETRTCGASFYFSCNKTYGNNFRENSIKGKDGGALVHVSIYFQRKLVSG